MLFNTYRYQFYILSVGSTSPHFNLIPFYKTGKGQSCPIAALLAQCINNLQDSALNYHVCERKTRDRIDQRFYWSILSLVSFYLYLFFVLFYGIKAVAILWLRQTMTYNPITTALNQCVVHEDTNITIDHNQKDYPHTSISYM